MIQKFFWQFHLAKAHPHIPSQIASIVAQKNGTPHARFLGQIYVMWWIVGLRKSHPVQSSNVPQLCDCSPSWRICLAWNHQLFIPCIACFFMDHPNFYPSKNRETNPSHPLHPLQCSNPRGLVRTQGFTEEEMDKLAVGTWKIWRCFPMFESDIFLGFPMVFPCFPQNMLLKDGRFTAREREFWVGNGMELCKCTYDSASFWAVLHLSMGGTQTNSSPTWMVWEQTLPMLWAQTCTAEPLDKSRSRIFQPYLGFLSAIGGKCGNYEGGYSQILNGLVLEGFIWWEFCKFLVLSQFRTT